MPCMQCSRRTRAHKGMCGYTGHTRTPRTGKPAPRAARQTLGGGRSPGTAQAQPARRRSPASTSFREKEGRNHSMHSSTCSRKIPAPAPLTPHDAARCIAREGARAPQAGAPLLPAGPGAAHGKFSQGKHNIFLGSGESALRQPPYVIANARSSYGRNGA